MYSITNYAIELHPMISIGKLGSFKNLKQGSKEQSLTRTRTTFEIYGNDTNDVVIEEKN